MPPELLKIDRKLVQQQLDRILASRVFRSATRSRDLLRYVVEQSLLDAPPKEYTLATEVLGRASDYDPAVDATVRVEAGRLRHRLREYYDTEGKDDPVTVDIPKGAYAAVFAIRPEAGTRQAYAPEIETPAPEAAPATEPVRPPSPPSPAAEQRNSAPGRRNYPSRLAVGAALLAIVTTIMGIWAIVRARQKAPPIRSLAVLPFENLSGDPGQDYFADGITDELITMLAKNSSLRLVSRTSALQFKGVHRPLPQIASALGVDGILEGSISRSNDKIHINVQLIQASSDTHLWAESYDRSFQAASGLPREIALAIAAQLHRSVPPTTHQRYIKPEAHDAYLRGRYYWFTENNQKDIEYLKKAVDLQPDYALAWSGLSAAYDRSAIHGVGLVKDLAPLAEQSVHKALELDDSLADAHNSMAAYHLFFRYDPEAALKESDRTIELDPQYAEAYFLRSNIFQSLNRLNDAMDAEKKNTELDPLARPFSIPQLLTRMRNYDAAIREAQARLVAQPNDLYLHWELALAFQCKGMDEQAARETERVAQLDGDEAGARAIKRAFQRGGYNAILQMQLDGLKQSAAHQYVPPLEFAFAYARLRRKDEALQYLEQAYQAHAPALIWLQNWPQWIFVHSDERYRSIVRRIGLPPAW